jgi:hypothetical protein
MSLLPMELTMNDTGPPPSLQLLGQWDSKALCDLVCQSDRVIQLTINTWWSRNDHPLFCEFFGIPI